ncbi:MAG: alpha/beta hydrolase family esterase [Microthrixaceae bacterium]
MGDAQRQDGGRLRGGPGRRRTRRFVEAVALVAVVATAGVLAACAPMPPPTPTPTTVVPDAGTGKVPGAGVVPSGGCTSPTATPYPAGRTLVQFPWEGGHRLVIVDVPAGGADVTSGPRGVLLSLHPFTLEPGVWDQYSGLGAAGSARGYVVLTPLGSQPGPRWAVPGGLETGVDDIGFVAALLDSVLGRNCIDRNRQFAAGFSAGAAMAQALSCTLPGRMAAVAGSGGTNLTSLCPDSPGTGVMVLHGSADPIAPVTGSTVPFAPPLGLAVDAVVATDAARADCSPVPVSVQVAPTLVIDRYPGCADGRKVEYWRMLGSGHTWAGAAPIIDFIVGPTNTDFSATTAVLDFFDHQAA